MSRTSSMRLALLSFAVGAAADLSLGSFLSDAMVLQRKPESAVLWGGASPGATVSVSLDGAVVASAVADAAGSWQASLPPQPAGIEHTILVSDGASEIHLSDIAFGDVYLCTGQSK